MAPAPRLDPQLHEVKGITRVTYDLASKPPGTIERGKEPADFDPAQNSL